MMKTNRSDKRADADGWTETGEQVPGFGPLAAVMEKDTEAAGRGRAGFRESNMSDLLARTTGEETLAAKSTAQIWEGPAYLIWWLIIIAVMFIGYFVIS
ncbi:hypothetical protein DKP76_17485 [Falsochrobactrum shanghaiense]|uniref:Uncharacterized protein n=1 Tax=Falsochrobactrum shanghaiense TaxID=2201899 RepID=A0A316J454_9HYPH|nr:hypothetical protein [Falsochrobactrum shanghaiense]PWL16454.1 hypothetical protein DKP76_17485 [Falsochrobactrum shanghaiense]